jgi:predicted AlkP superfamily phosphohydrolase/phosphomutase/tetratricopeptide (TPR) repeat protein
MPVVASLLLALALLLPACRSELPSGRVVVLGLDGMDPQTVDLLMSEGKLPNFAKLRQHGAYGRLLSSKPLLSPVIWTTIATGKTPTDHGIGHFVAVNEKTGEQLPVTSHMRRVKALWNILSEAERKVSVVGWWATWPAESVRGAVVSDHTCYHFLFEDGFTGPKDLTGVIHPATLEEQLKPLIRRPGDLKLEEVTPFLKVSAEEFARPFEFKDDLSHFKWALATAQSYRDIGLHLWKQERPQVLMTYIEGVDSTSHLFGHLFRAKGLAGELAEQQRKFGSAVEEMYVYADRVIGDFLAVMDDRTTLMVLSDHGFELGALQDDPSMTRDMRRVSERFHRIEGILYLYGNRVKPRKRLNQPSLVDIAPTVLALSGLSPAQDMPGRVLTEALDLPSIPRTVASYEAGTQVAAGEEKKDAAIDPAIMERLRSLGYLDAQSPTGDRNLAALHFQAGRFADAAKAYQQMVQQNPNDGALRASLAGSLGALGRYDEALEQATISIDLQPVNPEAYHNRAVIQERKGNREAAIQDYRTALRYNSQYRPSRQALVRLTGSAELAQPKTEEEKKATVLAEAASQAARRGDYQAAMKQLDEAERVAPRYALVHQYRANVAFLMGDRAGAIAAMRKALEIEPDNALYKSNLKRLELSSGAGTPQPTPRG